MVRPYFKASWILLSTFAFVLVFRLYNSYILLSWNVQPLPKFAWETKIDETFPSNGLILFNPFKMLALKKKINAYGNALSNGENRIFLTNGYRIISGSCENNRVAFLCSIDRSLGYLLPYFVVYLSLDDGEVKQIIYC